MKSSEFAERLPTYRSDDEFDELGELDDAHGGHRQAWSQALSTSSPGRAAKRLFHASLPVRILAGGGALAVLLVLYLALAPADGPHPAGPARGWSSPGAQGRIASRPKPRYDDVFNPDDLTFTEEECDAYFPLLWKEIDRSIAFYQQPNRSLTYDYLNEVCNETDRTHLRVLVYDNRLYIKAYRQSDFSRTQGTLALLQQSLVTSRERVPNAEFCIGLEDWPGRGKFGLDRAPFDEEVWLLPDYSFFSWPEHIGTYHDARRRIEAVERAWPWEKKRPYLFWRGNMEVGKGDRTAMAEAAAGYPWNDIKPVNWATGENSVKIEDHCQWKYQAVADGNAYTGKLRYLQNCKTVIVTHRPRWLQHWTHLYNADWSSPQQNIVIVPYPPESKDDPPRERAWDLLPETMHMLLNNDARAKQIAETQYDFFRNRYVSPASATCYWRKAIKGYASVQNFTVPFHGNETSYDSWILMGMRNEHWRPGVQ